MTIRSHGCELIPPPPPLLNTTPRSNGPNWYPAGMLYTPYTTVVMPRLRPEQKNNYIFNFFVVQERSIPFEGEKFFTQCVDANDRPPVPETGLLDPQKVNLAYIILAHEEPDQVVRCVRDPALFSFFFATISFRFSNAMTVLLLLSSTRFTQLCRIMLRRFFSFVFYGFFLCCVFGK